MERVQGTHRIEKSLVDGVKDLAKKEHRSFNNALEVVLRSGLEAIKKAVK